MGTVSKVIVLEVHLYARVEGCASILQPGKYKHSLVCGVRQQALAVRVHWDLEIPRVHIQGREDRGAAQLLKRFLQNDRECSVGSCAFVDQSGI
jgi:hypothetical protein